MAWSKLQIGEEGPCEVPKWGLSPRLAVGMQENSRERDGTWVAFTPAKWDVNPFIDSSSPPKGMELPSVVYNIQNLTWEIMFDNAL